MRLELVKIDERVADIQDLELAASSRALNKFDEEMVRSWVFHDLQVEGVALYAEDMERALNGEDGSDFCDSVLLEQIRNYHDAVQATKLAAREDTPPTLDLMFTLQHRIEPKATDDPVRSDEGATDNYKHDVALPKDAIESAKAALISLQDETGAFHPVELAIEAQYQLLKAWPLARWNAAVSRLLTNLYLMQRGFPPIIVPASRRQQYYHALNYDIRRLRDLLLDCLRTQLDERERFFRQ